MNIVEKKNLFFYGTLRNEEVREAVIGSQAKNLNLIDGYLIGHKLFKVKNANYPLILRDSSSNNRLYGLIATDLDEGTIRKLDLFEGENYWRTEVSAYRANDSLEIISEIYSPKGSLQYTDEWTYQEWYKSEREFFFQQDFRRDGVRSPD